MKTKSKSILVLNWCLTDKILSSDFVPLIKMTDFGANYSIILYIEAPSLNPSNSIVTCCILKLSISADLDSRLFYERLKVKINIQGRKLVRKIVEKFWNIKTAAIN